MFGQSFYWGTIRKYIILFGTIFNDIVILRTEDDGSVAQAIRVPLRYGAKEKMLARVMQDPALDQEAALVLPQISFVYHDAVYDGDRKLNTVGRVVRKNETDVNRFNYQYNPVPYNFNFSLYAYVKNAEDGNKIIEQILPYFTPEWSATVHLIPEHEITVDIPIILNSVVADDIFEGQFKERRTLVWELKFTLKGYLFGPIRRAPIIKFANTRFFATNLTTDFDDFIANTNSANDEPFDTVQVYPGLDANGNPTTDPLIAIDPLLVDIEDDWDFVVELSGVVIEFE